MELHIIVASKFVDAVKADVLDRLMVFLNLIGLGSRGKEADAGEPSEQYKDPRLSPKQFKERLDDIKKKMPQWDKTFDSVLTPLLHDGIDEAHAHANGDSVRYHEFNAHGEVGEGRTFSEWVELIMKAHKKMGNFGVANFMEDAVSFILKDVPHLVRLKAHGSEHYQERSEPRASIRKVGKGDPYWDVLTEIGSKLNGVIKSKLPVTDQKPNSFLMEMTRPDKPEIPPKEVEVDASTNMLMLFPKQKYTLEVMSFDTKEKNSGGKINLLFHGAEMQHEEMSGATISKDKVVPLIKSGMQGWEDKDHPKIMTHSQVLHKERGRRIKTHDRHTRRQDKIRKRIVTLEKDVRNEEDPKKREDIQRILDRQYKWLEDSEKVRNDLQRGLTDMSPDDVGSPDPVKLDPHKEFMADIFKKYEGYERHPQNVSAPTQKGNPYEPAKHKPYESSGARLDQPPSEGALNLTDEGVMKIKSEFQNAAGNNKIKVPESTSGIPANDLAGIFFDAAMTAPTSDMEKVKGKAQILLQDYMKSKGLPEVSDATRYRTFSNPKTQSGLIHSLQRMDWEGVSNLANSIRRMKRQKMREMARRAYMKPEDAKSDILDAWGWYGGGRPDTAKLQKVYTDIALGDIGPAHEGKEPKRTISDMATVDKDLSDAERELKTLEQGKSGFRDPSHVQERIKKVKLRIDELNAEKAQGIPEKGHRSPQKIQQDIEWHKGLIDRYEAKLGEESGEGHRVFREAAMPILEERKKFIEPKPVQLAEKPESRWRFDTGLSDADRKTRVEESKARIKELETELQNAKKAGPQPSAPSAPRQRTEWTSSRFDESVVGPSLAGLERAMETDMEGALKALQIIDGLSSSMDRETPRKQQLPSERKEPPIYSPGKGMSGGQHGDLMRQLKGLFLRGFLHQKPDKERYKVFEDYLFHWKARQETDPKLTDLRVNIMDRFVDELSLDPEVVPNVGDDEAEKKTQKKDIDPTLKRRHEKVEAPTGDVLNLHKFVTKG